MISGPDIRDVRKTIDRCTKLASELTGGPYKEGLKRAASMIFRLARRPLGDPLNDASFEAHRYMMDHNNKETRVIYLNKNGDVLGYLVLGEEETYKFAQDALSHYDKIAGVS